MKDFQLSRYLKTWWWVIALASALAGILLFLFMSSRQTYRAQTMIEFTNERASEGLYPTGKEIDVQEIRSSTVISYALESIGESRSVDEVRACIGIKESISEEEEAIRTAKWTSGETYDDFPTKYIISYTSARGETATEAQRILEAVIDSYIRLYSEKYVSIAKVPTSIESLQNLNYDYIEWADIVDEYIKQNRDYLQTMKGAWPNFRSSRTGYSFQDIYNEYNLVYTSDLPSLYAEILNGHLSADPDMLVTRFRNRIDQNNLVIRNCEEDILLIEQMIKNYTEKNRDTMDYHWKVAVSGDGEAASTDALGNNYVLGTVYDFEHRDNYSSEETTYDSIINHYVRLRSEIVKRTLDNEHSEKYLEAFAGTNAKPDGKAEAAARALISRIEERLEELDAIMLETAAEHSEVETVRNVRIRSTVNVDETMNIKLYTLLIVLLFFVFGTVGAVIIGRSLDFVEYHFYTDSSTGMPNRLQCDREIEKHAQKMLAFPFTGVMITPTNMNEINKDLGRNGGNEVLRIMADYIAECAEGYGFVGYNGGLQFIGLFPDCDEDRAGYFAGMLSRLVAEFNRGGYGTSIRYKIASVTAAQDTPYTMHELLAAMTRKLRVAPEVQTEEVPEDE